MPVIYGVVTAHGNLHPGERAQQHGGREGADDVGLEHADALVHRRLPV